MAINLTKVGGLVDIQGLGADEYIVDSSSTRPSIKLFGTNNVLVLSTSIGVINIPFAAVTDFEVEGVPVTDLADFKTKIATVFPDANGGSGGSTIYTGDGSLEGNRTINLDGHLLNFTDDNGFSYIYTTPGGDSKLNNTDGNNTVRIEAAGGDAFFLLYAESISESGQVSINGDAIAKVITHTANKHNFNSILNLAVFANASPADGDIWREDNTNTGLKIRIDGVTKTITVS